MHSTQAAEKVRRFVRAYMADNGIASERDMALRADMDQSPLHRFLSGKTHQLSVDNLMKLSAYIGCTVSELIGEVKRGGYSGTHITRTLRAMEQLPPPLQKAVADLATNLSIEDDEAAQR